MNGLFIWTRIFFVSTYIGITIIIMKECLPLYPFYTKISNYELKKQPKPRSKECERGVMWVVGWNGESLKKIKCLGLPLRISNIFFSKLQHFKADCPSSGQPWQVHSGKGGTEDSTSCIFSCSIWFFAGGSSLKFWQYNAFFQCACKINEKKCYSIQDWRITYV